MDLSRTRFDIQRVNVAQDENGERRGRRHRRPRRRSSWTAFVLVVSVLLIGVGATFMVRGYMSVYGHEGQTQDNQRALEEGWNNDNPDVVSVPGQTTGPTPRPIKTAGSSKPAALAKLTIPSLNKTWYVVNGIDNASLRQGPGHYPGTAMPGQVGNFSVAGHREPGMFWDLDKVKDGQQIIVETKTARYTYKVVANFLVKPNDSWVVGPTPPGTGKGARLVTLTTCNPKWDNYQRLIVRGLLIDTVKL